MDHHLDKESKASTVIELFSFEPIVITEIDLDQVTHQKMLLGLINSPRHHVTYT